MLAALAMAFQALATNKLRSVLTILGTVIGVGCVVALWNMGESSRQYMGGALSSIGQNLVMVRPKWDAEDPDAKRTRYRPLRTREYHAVRDHCPSVASVSPMLWGQAEALYGKQRKRVQIRGCAPSFLEIRGWTVERGLPFGEGDLECSTRVVLLGANVVRELFGSLEAVGQTVLLEKVPFRVLGVLKAKGSLFGENQDDQILAPYTALLDHLGWGTDYHMLWASARSREVVAQAKREILLAVREAQHLPSYVPDSVALEDLGEVAASVDKVLVGFSLFLGAIGAVSLLVGGIGIMNIMLVSVTERTREIGLRMALGATDFAILTQFLIEATVLSSLGGALGILFGSGAALGATVVLSRLTETKWPPVIAPGSLVVALLVALGVGVFFGFYPAWRASRLDPIEALRHE
jgi:putative ABC transport system permease protein